MIWYQYALLVWYLKTGITYPWQRTKLSKWNGLSFFIACDPDRDYTSGRIIGWVEGMADRSSSAVCTCCQAFPADSLFGPCWDAGGGGLVRQVVDWEMPSLCWLLHSAVLVHHSTRPVSSFGCCLCALPFVQSVQRPSGLVGKIWLAQFSYSPAEICRTSTILRVGARICVAVSQGMIPG